MATSKTVFYLGTDTHSVFDASSLGHRISANRKVNDLGNERLLKIDKGGFLKLDRSEQLDNLRSFSLEAFIRPKIIGERMNILEAQQPSVALLIDSRGKLVGAVHTDAGWQSVDSGNIELTAENDYFVRFSKDSRGNLTLEINENEVGKKQVTEGVVNVGDEVSSLAPVLEAGVTCFQGR